MNEQHKIPGGEPDEVGFVGAAIVDAREIDRYGVEVLPEHFLDEALGQAWRALVVMREANRPINPNTLVPELLRMNVPPTVANMEFLLGAIRDAATANSMALLAEQIQRAAALRRQYRDAAAIVQMTLAPNADPMEISRMLESAASATDGPDQDETIYIADAERQALAAARQASENRGSIVYTGITDVDAVLGPMRSGELLILGAKTGQGKSTLANQIAHDCALHQRPALVVSLEMTPREIGARRLCARTGIDSQRFRSGDLPDADWKKAERAIAGMDDPKAYSWRLWCPASTTIRRLRAVAKRQKARHGLAILFVDYLQLADAEPGNKNRARYIEVQEVSRGLKKLAVELDCVVVALSQFSRAADESPDRPRLSWLRESGSLEQDADAVLFIHHDLAPDGSQPISDEPTRAEIIIAKHRHGQRAIVPVTWYPGEFRFGNGDGMPAPAPAPPPNPYRKSRTNSHTAPPGGREWRGA